MKPSTNFTILRYFLVLLAGSFISFSAVSQQVNSKPVTLNLDSAFIGTLVKELEPQTGLHFYYDSKQFDSLRIIISVKDKPLSEVLDQVFANTDFHYTVIDEKFIFITRGITLRTTLPESFFPGKQIDSSRTKQTVPDFNASRKAAVDPSVENRLFEIGIKTNSISHAKATFAGFVRNGKTGEPVVGAYLSIENSSTGVSTDQYGYYSLTIPRGSYILNIQGIGMKDTRRRITLYTDGKLNIDLVERVSSLKEVIVSAAKVANVRRVSMGVERLSIKNIKQMPAIFGEADILRAVLTLPGVKTVGEASTGFNVRGGSTDQNLILFNDATIFNPSHFFGFFSAFNPDVVKDVELFKSSIPAKYGGRLASVLNITSREGNKKKMAGTAGIGPLTSRFNLEGPIIKDKMSFIAGVRATYANWLMGLLPGEYKDSKASFYDVNLHLSYQPGNKDNLYFTGYLSKDRFNLNNDTTYHYSNNNISVKWKHSFNNKFNSEVTAGYDQYDYSTYSSQLPVAGYKLAFNIGQLNTKADFTWFLHPKHTADFGISYIRYQLHPGNYNPEGEESLVRPDTVAREQGREMAIYLSDRWNVGTNLSIHAGIRYSMFSFLGPADVNMYAPGLPKNSDNLLDVKNVSSGSAKNYHGPECRLSARYNLTGDFSIKAGFNSQRQYIHMLSNTTAISPTDIWKLSDPNIKPQYGEQVSLGLYKNFKGNTIETSIEVYYKKIKNYLDYKSGAELVMNHHIETDVMNTKGKAYGAEFMIRKQAGKLNGWLSYTYSRILLKQNDPTITEIINRGEYYPAIYDKPHDVTMVGNYRLSHRFSVSLNTTYSTGRPITIPIGRYYYAGSQRALYSDRNSYRIPDYFRADMSMNIDGNHKVNQKTHSSWTIGLYNLTGRKNAYSVYYVSEAGLINGYKLSIFGSIIPFVNYNIRF
jgi:hypothetical protein